MFSLIKSITRDEWKFWLKVLVAVLILTSLSRAAAIIFTPQDFVWRGNVVFSWGDRYVYVSYIEQARAGAYLFEDLFTAKSESVAMLNLFWLGAGLFARLTHLSANATLEILRIILIPFLLLASYLLIAYFVKDIWQRKLAHLLAVLGSGWGVILLPLLFSIFGADKLTYNLPIDLDTAEAFIFTSAYYSAHFIFSTFLFIAIILLTLLASDNKKIIYALPAGILSLVLANFHPFTFAIIFIIFFSYWLFLFFKNRGQAFFLFKYALLVGIIALPSIIYHLRMFYSPWWQNQTWNSNTIAPSVISIASGYGLLLVFAVLSLWREGRAGQSIWRSEFFFVWFLSQIMLIFLPVSVQRRFFEGYSVMLAILASYSLGSFIQKRKHIFLNKTFGVIFFILAFSWSPFFIIIVDLRNVILRGNMVYVKKDAVSAMRELKNVCDEENLVISDIYNSSMIPGLSLRRVFLGHGVETINYDAKYEILRSFMAEKDPAKRKGILENYNIGCFLYDETWKKDWQWNPDEEKYLQKVYERHNYKIYKIK